MNIEAKILSNNIQKGLYTIIKLDLFQDRKSGSTYADPSLWYSTSKEKTEPHDHLNRCRESISQNSTFIHGKKKKENSCLTVGRKKYISEHNKSYLWETYSQHTKEKKLKAFPLNSGIRMPTLPTFIQHSIGSPSHSNQKGKRNKRYPNWKGRSQIIIMCRWQDTLCRRV